MMGPPLSTGRISAIGEKDAEGIIDMNGENHHHHFMSLLYGEPDKESKLWIGLHPIVIAEEPAIGGEKPAAQQPFCNESLLRGLGYKGHSFCVGVLKHWTAAQRKDFIYFQLQVRKEECNIRSPAIAPKFSVNCTTTLADDDVKNEIASCQDVILEITDFPSHISDFLHKTQKDQPGLEVWLDDVPPEKWPELPALMSKHQNMKGIKIDVKTSMLLLQRSSPMLAQGVPNDHLEKIFHNTPQSDINELRGAFKALVQDMVRLRRSWLVVELDCTLADFEWTGCREALRGILGIQGLHNHAMVHRLHCDYSKHAIDKSPAEKHVPQRYHLYGRSDVL